MGFQLDVVEGLSVRQMTLGHS